MDLRKPKNKQVISPPPPPIGGFGLRDNLSTDVIIQPVSEIKPDTKPSTPLNPSIKSLVIPPLKPLNFENQSKEQLWFKAEKGICVKIRFLPNDEENAISGDFCIEVLKHWKKNFICKGKDCIYCKNDKPRREFRCNILTVDDNKVRMFDITEWAFTRIYKYYMDLGFNPTDFINNQIQEVTKDEKGHIIFKSIGDFTTIADTTKKIDEILSRLHDLNPKKRS